MGQTRASAWAPGTCGELVEGSIGGRSFLVTCPIELGSRVEVFEEFDAPDPFYCRRYPKTAAALKLLAARFGVATIPGFRRESSLIPGKGLGSSTADIAAALAAAARLWGLSLEPAKIAAIALTIEPTDGLMFEGLVLFDHLAGSFREELGPAPPLNLLVLDPGGDIDTIKFNRRKELAAMNRRKEPQVRQALKLVKDGLSHGDLEQLGRGATVSALANQELLPKPDLPQVLRWAEDLGAVGVNVAHSGTVMGLLLPPNGISPPEALEFIRARRPDWQFYPTRLIGGGLR